MIHSGLVTGEGTNVPLLGVEVTGEVLADRAHIHVRQRYRNDERKPVEAVYTFPLPPTATLVGFAMTCEGRRLDGQVKEREEAFRAYDDALVAGHGAALLDQERANVFTASVGNLLPGEETLIEVTYVQRLRADEGALRWMMPTLVAPRYIPGKPKGNRTGHGAADPTDVVPDADRITPRIGDVRYGLRLDVVFDLGLGLAVECPSHRVQVTAEGRRTRVRFAQDEVALDRDVVITARGAEDRPLDQVVGHAGAGGEPGTLALTVVPDLGAGGAVAPQSVVFVIDTSGSMDGASIVEARAALRLCLRHLREGDRFDVIAFADRFDVLAPAPLPFTQKTLEQADRWVESLKAHGGTEMLGPLLEAVKLAPDGVVVLLTDGQVGNEDQILADVLAARGTARVHTFGIGTNVSDALLGDLARRTGGAMEQIHPGERIDEKVVAQFARALAPRVTDVTLAFDGVEVGELAPGVLPAIVDGEPWTVLGRVNAPRRGKAEIRGKLGGKPFHLGVPIDPECFGDRPILTTFWAADRVRDLEAMEVTGRRAGRMKERIVELAVKHGIASRYTSFVVVEQRSGNRRANQLPESRFIPVNVPAGWAMFEKKRARTPMPMMAGTLSVGGMGAGPLPPSPPPSARAGGWRGLLGMADREVPPMKAMAVAPEEMMQRSAGHVTSMQQPSGAVALLSRQLASGLWDDGGRGDDETRRIRATARALLELEAEGIDAAHPLHGAQVKKAASALSALAATVANRTLAELALCVAWLVTRGGRTRAELARRLLNRGIETGDEPTVRARVTAALR